MVKKYLVNPFTREFDLVLTPDGSYANQYDTDSGTAVPSGSILNIYGGKNVTTAGAGNTITINALSPITKYVVDSFGSTDYTTIQSAIDAAHAAGGGVVYVRPGTYNENLVFYDAIILQGATAPIVGSLSNTIVNGTHTPPNSGNINLTDLLLQSATDIFSSAAAGTCGIYIQNSVFAITDGYIFNLPNWSGLFNINNCGEASTHNGLAYNTNSAYIFTNNSEIGAGTNKTFTANGFLRFDLTYINTPSEFKGAGLVFANLALFGKAVTIGGTRTGTIGLASEFFATLTLEDTVTLTITETTFSTGATTAIASGAGTNISLANITINSSANPVITGSGTVEFGSVTYLSGYNIAGGITKNYTTRLETGQLKIDDAETGVLLANTGVISAETMTNGQLVIGNTGNVPTVANLTSAGGTVTITNGAGSINLEVPAIPPGGIVWTRDVLAAVALASNEGHVPTNVGLTTYTLPAVAALGTIIEILGESAGGWRIAQNAGQNIQFGNLSTTPGVGGRIDSNNRYDCIRLICRVANTTWSVSSAAGAPLVT